MLRKVLTSERTDDIMILRNATVVTIAIQGGENMKKEKRYPTLYKIKGRIKEKGETYRTLSRKTGIKLNTLSDKINGYSLFDIVEAGNICIVLSIPPEQIPIFFEINVA